MSKKYLTKNHVVLIANGSFPKKNRPLQIINDAEYIICCDGAANSMRKTNREADIIIGDLDSIDSKYLKNIKSQTINIDNQNDNDLRKALNWITKNIKVKKIMIIGITGLREDHTLGNIASFLYNKYDFEIEIITDTGHFYIISEFKTIQTSIGQPISLFCIDEKQRITTEGLKYKLENDSINLYNATLNIAEKEQITISLKLDVPVLVYLYCENEKN
jgi:thiamine pyrophosphokinase